MSRRDGETDTRGGGRRTDTLLANSDVKYRSWFTTEQSAAGDLVDGARAALAHAIHRY